MVPIYALVGIMTYWSFWSIFSTPLTIVSYKLDPAIYHGTVKVDHGRTESGAIILHPSDLVTITSESRRHSTCVLSINRILQNKHADYSYYVNTSTRKITPNPHVILHNQMLIPPNIVPGDYWLYSRLSLICNPMGYLFPIELSTTQMDVKIEASDDANLKNSRIIQDFSEDEKAPKPAASSSKAAKTSF
jgi:hypothetical protein